MVGVNQADQALAFARAQIGKPYVFGATGPNSYDCSGLVQAAYKSAGIAIGRTTYQQVLNGTAVDKASLAIGDLVFPDAGHVQIYAGGGMIVEAPHSGANVREVAMWGFWKARRIVPGGGTGAITTTVGLSNPIGNPITTADQLAEAIKTGVDLFNLAADPGTYKRLGAITVGAISVLIGLSLIGFSSIDISAVTSAAKSVKKVTK